MAENLDDLILDLLEWLDGRPRPYAEVLEAWRTSCPRPPVWEEVNDQGFIERKHTPGRGQLVSVSVPGAAYLRRCRALASPARGGLASTAEQHR
jgi:D-3-phosphoglycerate dehydrogenase